jgi:hypothetical protein
MTRNEQLLFLGLAAAGIYFFWSRPSTTIPPGIPYGIPPSPVPYGPPTPANDICNSYSPNFDLLACEGSGRQMYSAPLG